MSTATMDEPQEKASTLSSVFALSAIGGVAAFAFLGAADPLTLILGGTAILSGIGAAVEKMPPTIGLSVAAAALTTFILGLPMEFLTEHIVFPYAHESGIGQETVGWASSILVPFYDSVGQFFGIEPLGQAVEGVPQADF